MKMYVEILSERACSDLFLYPITTLHIIEALAHLTHTLPLYAPYTKYPPNNKQPAARSPSCLISAAPTHHDDSVLHDVHTQQISSIISSWCNKQIVRRYLLFFTHWTRSVSPIYMVCCQYLPVLLLLYVVQQCLQPLYNSLFFYLRLTLSDWI